jgi:sarcosine oxidase subunit beta
MVRTYDAIVIGAGVIGASIAYHLTRAGVGRVALVERRTVCSGNTRKSGAIVRMHYTNDPEARLALFSLPYFQHWAEMVGGDCSFRQTGFALLVGPENVERLERNVQRLRRLGVETSALGPGDLREVMPSLKTDGVAAGAYEPLSGHADPIATTRSLVDAAVARGVELLERTPVSALAVSGGRISGVETNAGRLDAPVVVCAANTWSPALLATADVALPVAPRRAQVGYFERPAEHVGPHLVLLDTTTAMYTRPNGDREILGGAADVTGAAPTDPDCYDESADPDFAPAVLERLGARVPSLAAARFSRGEAGLYDMSPDTRAIIDRAPGVGGLYVAAGFSGTGFKKAPAIGAGLADMITTGESRRVDLEPFRLSRFDQHRPVHGDDEYVLPQSWGHSF